MRWLIGPAQVLLAVFFASMILPAKAQDANVSVQIVNPAEGTLVRIFLDRQLIYEGTPDKASLGGHGVLSAVAGSFKLDGRKRHILTAEAPAASTKTQFEWIPRHDASPWIVIRYYPGRRAEPEEPPFFILSLQADSYKLR